MTDKKFLDEESKNMKEPFWEVDCPICGLYYRAKSREELRNKHGHDDHSKEVLDTFWRRG